MADDHLLRERVLRALADDDETIGLLRSFLEQFDEPVPDDEVIWQCLREMESEGLVHSYIQEVKEETAGWIVIPEIARGDQTVRWWRLTQRSGEPPTLRRSPPRTD